MRIGFGGVLYFAVGERALGKVINLNKYRKRKAKLEREKQADANRRLHGRTAAERARDELQKRQLTRAVEGAKLEGAALDNAVLEGAMPERAMFEGAMFEGAMPEGDERDAAKVQDAAGDEAPEPRD